VLIVSGMFQQGWVAKARGEQKGSFNFEEKGVARASYGLKIEMYDRFLY